MQTLAIVSDSHVPDRASEVPPSFRDRISAADHVVHAGDLTSPDALDRFRAWTDGDLTAVSGNMDPRTLDLPTVATASVGGRTVVVTHGTGSPHSYEERVASTVREVAGPGAVGVAGHTHEVLDVTLDGVRLLNPGSVTGAAPAERATMMTAEVGDGALDVTVHEA